MHQDVIVIGPGAVGSPAAWTLAELGTRVVGTGSSGHEFTLGPACGNALAASAPGEGQRSDLSAFSPRRFAR